MALNLGLGRGARREENLFAEVQGVREVRSNVTYDENPCM